VTERLAEHARKSLSDHLEAFKTVLEGKGNTAKHVAVTLSDCRQIIRECGFSSPRDLDPVKVSKWVTQQKSGGCAARTINRKVGALKSFTRWLLVDGRLRTDPMIQVRKLNVQADRRRERRALTDPEVSRLIYAAETGSAVFRMSGPGPRDALPPRRGHGSEGL